MEGDGCGSFGGGSRASGSWGGGNGSGRGGGGGSSLSRHTPSPGGARRGSGVARLKPRSSTGASTTDDGHLVSQAFGWRESVAEEGTAVHPVDVLSQVAVNAPAKATSEVWYRVLLTFGACCAGLMAATTQAFNTISKDVMLDTGTSDVFVSLLTGFGLAGLQFTIFAGISLDVLGAWRTCLLGNAVVVAGYFAMSYTTAPWLLVPELALVGLGSGAAFLSGFKTVIELGNPLGVGLTSCSMSVSIFVTIALKNALLDATSCQGVGCWRQVVRLDGAVCGVAFLIAACCFMFRHKVPDLAQADAPEPRHRRSSSTQSVVDAFRGASTAKAAPSGCSAACSNCTGGLFVFKDPFFWKLAVADIAGLGCGIFVIAAARQLWHSFDATSHQGDTILKVLSIAAAVGNVGYPVVSDYLATRGYMSRVRLMAATLFLYALVFTAMLVLNMAYAQRATAPPPVARWAMLVLLSSVGFGFGAALVGFPVCVSSAFPVKYFGTILSYTQIFASTFSVVNATVTAAVFRATGSYNWMYGGMAATLALGALLLALPHRRLDGDPAAEPAPASPKPARHPRWGSADSPAKATLLGGAPPGNLNYLSTGHQHHPIGEFVAQSPHRL